MTNTTLLGAAILLEFTVTLNFALGVLLHNSRVGVPSNIFAVPLCPLHSALLFIYSHSLRPFLLRSSSSTEQLLEIVRARAGLIQIKKRRQISNLLMAPPSFFLSLLLLMKPSTWAYDLLRDTGESDNNYSRV